MAIDREDNIYLVDKSISTIFKSDRNCSNVQLHRVEQVEGPGYYDIAVVGDEVMVTECRNKGVVMVYNREVKFKRLIQCTTHDPLSGLCIDSYQNLYVCNYWNLKILVYSKGGEVLRSFGNSNNNEKLIKIHVVSV